MDKVIFKKESAIASLVLNRPEKRNAIDDDVMKELKDCIAEVKQDSNIKCLIITGAGNQAFCSGGDLSVFHKLKTAQDAEGMLTKMGNILYELFTLQKPTIALLNGTAVGGGAEMATACDFRVAYSDVSIGFIQGTLGITTGWGGAAYLFERLPSQTALALLSSAKKIKAVEAYQLGYLHKVMTDRDTSYNSFQQLADEMLPLSSNVLAAYKRRYLDTVDFKGLKTRIEKEIRECAILWEKEEHAKAVDQFLKR